MGMTYKIGITAVMGIYLGLVACNQNTIQDSKAGVDSIKMESKSLLDTAEEKPLQTAKVGEVIKGKLTIISPKNRNLFTVNDAIPAGFELVNFNLATEDQTNLIVNTDTNTSLWLKVRES
jgi:uncharacterized protein YfaS (alpha-2-macroglobulin family)